MGPSAKLTECESDMPGGVGGEGGVEGRRRKSGRGQRQTGKLCFLQVQELVLGSEVIMGQGQAARRRGLVVRSLSAKPNIIAACLHPAGLRHVGAQTSAMQCSRDFRRACC